MYVELTCTITAPANGNGVPAAVALRGMETLMVYQTVDGLLRTFQDQAGLSQSQSRPSR